MSESFGAALARIAGRVSAEQIRRWQVVLEAADGPSGQVESRLSAVRLAAADEAVALVSAWRGRPDLTGPAVALALAAVSAAHEEADRNRPRLVASGPTTDMVPVRLTASVVSGLIRRATDRVLLVSFAAYGVREVVRELTAALDRGVRVDLVLENTVDQGSVPSGGPFAGLAGRARIWHWPSAHRGAGGRAALHAKVVVADRREALLSSANLTDRGLLHNIEVGFLVRDQAAGALDGHFRALMRADSHCLVRVRPFHSG